MNADGTGATDLTQDYYYFEESPSWSPDGSKIAFTRIDRFGVYDQVWTMKANGSGYALVAEGSGNHISDHHPAWSPDGTKIAFESVRPGSQVIVTVDPSGANQTDIAFGRHPDWQPIPYTGYARPKGASPFQTYLVPAYKQCVAPNRTHGAPLAFPSCNPPVQSSNFLTVGTLDANGQGAKSTGIVFLAARPDNPPTSPADMVIAISITDVRNKADLSDYTGSVQEIATWRITDNYNGIGQQGLTESATMIDIPFPTNVPCSVTADSTVGSTCAVKTTANAVVPGTVNPKKRMIVALGQVQVYDGGSDGNPPPTPQTNTLFMDQGIFIP
jgi:hypothetical protein